ncbi:MAG TPA: DedA family protein [Terriglobales bacterium]|jgi:membrane protein DedA with SNARE-associated domain|nr:DedA family protein [Terriglobales bacterium]HKW68578.1 DedA family protein [Terriglobales bacterium]HYL94321.1 DedA family protein [Terriglobales bacterium]
MTAKIIAALSAFIISVISAGGYLGIAVLMAIESACIPLPSEIIMPFSGYLVYLGRFKLLWVATVGALGCNLGSAIAYAVGYYGGRPLVEKYGSYILLSRHELDWADRFFARYGNITVFVSRLLPVIRTFIALPAGVARMNQPKFHFYTFIGSWPWCLGLAFVGMKLGQRWDTDPRLRIWFHRFDAVILAVILIGIVVFVWTRWQGRIRADDAVQNSGL